MKMVVAELLAKMGFDIDTSDLSKLDNHIRSMRASSTLLARNLRVLNSQLNATRNNLNGMNRSLNASTAKRSVRGLGGSYSAVSRHAREAEKAVARFGRVLGIVEPRITSFNTRMISLTATWTLYIDRLREANRQLINVRNNSNSIRNAPPINTGGRGGRGGNGQGGRGGLGAGAAAAFVGAFSPAGLVAGGGLGAAVAVKELVTAGREVQKMRQAMLVATGSAQEQGKALEYVDKQATRLGVSYTEMGKAYAQAKIATDGKLNDQQLQDMMTAVSEFSTTMHLSADDQKGVFRAMTQMFSKGKISLEEINQMAERGIPALKLMQEASKKFYKVDDAGFQKMIQKGEIITKDIFPLMAAQMGEMARKGGALDKAINSSTAAQQRLVNEWQKFADTVMQNGLDQALGKLFNGMTKLFIVAAPLAKAIGEATIGLVSFIKVISDFLSEHPKLIAAMATIITLFIMKGRTARGAGSMVNQFFVFLILAMQRLKGLLARFPILALFLALFEVFKAFGQYMKGEDNWLTFLGRGIAITVMKIELLMEKLKTLFVVAKQGIIDILTDNFITDAWSSLTDRIGIDGGGRKVVPSTAGREEGRGMPVRIPFADRGIPTSGGVPNPFMRGQAVVDLNMPNQPTQRVVVPLSSKGQVINTGGLRP